MSELDDLIERRTEKVRLMKADGDNSHETLAKLYGNPTHFITELLQNAEDEGANNVEFILTQDELIFSHDAKKLFDFSDIRAISNFGDNHEKKEKPNAIGRFGIGFKSVYSITDKPRIISANFDITILEYNIPQRTVNENHTFFNGTKIILPFKSEAREKTRELLTKELQDLNLQYLLFLSKIRSIKWVTENNEGIYERSTQNKDQHLITLKSENKEQRYIIFEKLLPLDGKRLSIKIAFQLANNERRVVIPSEKSPLFVFFPTKIETNLKFLVHAPFYTTPARENIQENDNLIAIEKDHRNELLKKELGILLVESLAILKSMKLLNVELLNALPINKSNCNRSSIYKELYEAVKREFSSNKNLIPNTYGAYSSAKDSLLLGSADLAELLTKKQANKLFGRSFWISKNITNDKTKELRDYIRYDLEVPEYDLTSFAAKIDAEFMLEQTDNWIIEFYKVVHKAHALWRTSPQPANRGILRSKPIIRIETNGQIKQVIPYQSSGKPNAFLPAREASQYATVKNNIARNKEARKFLEDIGLTVPDLFAELNEFVVPKLKTGVNYQGYFEDFNKILEAIQSTNQEKRSRLIKDLRECPFILGINYETGEMRPLKYTEVYFFNENLKAYFAGNSSAFFVAEEQYALPSREANKFHAFFSEIGVISFPRRKSFTANLTWDEKKKLRNGAYATYDHYCIDYDLDGLLNFFSHPITIEKSVALWQLLCKCISSEPQNAQSFFQGEYSYKYYNDYYRKFEASFLKKLKQTSWLFLDNEQFLPNEISYSNLPEKYRTNNDESKLLGDILGFKPDEITLIEERTGGKFVSADKYEKFKKWESEQEKLIENIDEPLHKFAPKFKPEEADLNTREWYDFEISVEFRNEQGTNSSNLEENKADDKPLNLNNREEIQLENTLPQTLLNDIGDWGQSYVGRDLIKEFEGDVATKVIDLNEKGQKGVGCDFKVIKNEEIVKLVEVKTTVEKFGHALSISGTQWEVARTFFKQDNGDKYWIYCVFNAGQSNAEIIKIQNPIKKWKEGKLIAHPINFIIK